MCCDSMGVKRREPVRLASKRIEFLITMGYLMFIPLEMPSEGPGDLHRLIVKVLPFTQTPSCSLALILKFYIGPP